MEMYIALQVKCFYATLNGSKLTPFVGHGNYLRCVKWKEESSMKTTCRRKCLLLPVKMLSLLIVVDGEYQ